MAINKRAEKKAKKEERKTKRAKMTKSEKYGDCLIFFALVSCVFLPICMYMSAVQLFKFAFIAFILFAISALLCVLFIFLGIKESNREEKKELDRKESLINKLNKTEFKEIKLEETEDRFFHAFLNNKIEARIHKDNEDIIDVRFWFKDDIGFEVHKVAPFSREDLIEAIDDVIGSDNN